MPPFVSVQTIFGGIMGAVAHLTKWLGVLALLYVFAEVVGRTLLETTVSRFLKPYFEKALSSILFLKYWVFNIDIYFDIEAILKFDIIPEDINFSDLKKGISSIEGVALYQSAAQNWIEFRIQRVYDFSLSIHQFEEYGDPDDIGTEIHIRNRSSFSVGYRNFNKRIAILQRSLLAVKDAVSMSSNKRIPMMEIANLSVTLTTNPEKMNSKSNLIMTPNISRKDRIENLYVYRDIPAMEIHFTTMSALDDNSLKYLPLTAVK